MNKTYTEEQLKNLFEHHPPNDEQVEKYKEIRKHENLTYKLISDVFSSPEKVTGDRITHYNWPIQKVTLSYAWAINELCPPLLLLESDIMQAIDCVLMVKHALIEHVHSPLPLFAEALDRIAVENCFKARVLACRSIALADVE